MNARKCLDCGCDISNRFILAQRCVTCAARRSGRHMKKRVEGSDSSAALRAPEANPVAKGSPIVEKTCRECGKPFPAPRSSHVLYCDKCRAEVRARSRERANKRCQGDLSRFGVQAIRRERAGLKASVHFKCLCRDMEHKALNVPVTVSVDHRGVRRETRGRCAGGYIPIY